MSSSPRDYAAVIPLVDRFNHDAVDKVLNRVAELLIEQANEIERLQATLEDAARSCERVGSAVDGTLAEQAEDVWQVRARAIVRTADQCAEIIRKAARAAREESDES